MSTQLTEADGGFYVATVTSPGGRKQMARGRVFVPAGNPGLLKAEIVRQAKAARLALGISQKALEPVE